MELFLSARVNGKARHGMPGQGRAVQSESLRSGFFEETIIMPAAYTFAIQNPNLNPSVPASLKRHKQCQLYIQLLLRIQSESLRSGFFEETLIMPAVYTVAVKNPI